MKHSDLLLVWLNSKPERKNKLVLNENWVVSLNLILPLVRDPPHAKSNPMQNATIFQTPTCNPQKCWTNHSTSNNCETLKFNFQLRQYCFIEPNEQVCVHKTRRDSRTNKISKKKSFKFSLDFSFLYIYSFYLHEYYGSSILNMLKVHIASFGIQFPFFTMNSNYALPCEPLQW